MCAEALRHGNLPSMFTRISFSFGFLTALTRTFGKNSILKKTKIWKNLKKQQLKRILLYIHIHTHTH